MLAIAVPVVLANTMFASLVGYGIWNTLLAKYPTSSVVPFTLLVPVIGILAAWVVVNEQPSVSELIGGAIMLAGLAIAVIVWHRPVPELKPFETPSG